MKNFLAVFDIYRMSVSTMKYAIQVTKSSGGHLVGVMLDETVFYGHDRPEEIAQNKEVEKAIKELNKEEAKKREEATEEFTKKCKEAGISFSVHKNGNMNLRELKNESMYADMIIINQHETFTSLNEKPPTHFLKDLLGDVQCPVLAVPRVYKPVENFVLLYDGAPAALYAIKMFSYVMGNPRNLPIKVFTVKEKKKAGFFMPDNKKIREFTKGHFPKATFAVASGNAEQEISSYLGSLPKNQMVVLGAYQRSEISRWFKISMADILMRELEIPLFIAHNR